MRTKVKIVESYIHYRSASEVLPSVGHSASRWIYDRSCDAPLVQSQTYGYLPSAVHCRCPL